MKAKKIFFYFILLFIVMIQSIILCSKSVEPISGKYDFEIISYSQLPSNIDSNLVYYKYYNNWESIRDTVRADRIADYFGNNFNSVLDMWFPQTRSTCEWGLKDNFIFVRFSKPEPSLFSQGFNKGGIIYCWEFFRHYKYNNK